MAVEPGEVPCFAPSFLVFRFARIKRMRRPALVEEAAEQDQRSKLQDGGLPIRGEPFQKGAG
jgi:hypothetical protein